MGKRSRRPSRRNRQDPTSGRTGLTVTVGVAPTPSDNNIPELANELRLLRSSLLYADNVDLIAPSVGWLETFRPLLTLSEENPWQGVADLPPETLQRLGVNGVSYRSFRRQMRHLGQLPMDDPQRMEGESLWKPAITDLVAEASTYLGSPESKELSMAVDTGAVALIGDGTRFEDTVDQQIGWFRDRLVESLNDPGSSVLLDEVATGFIRGSKVFGVGLPAMAENRSKRSSVGTGLVERLPTFPDAPMSLVLEAREELSEGRSMYRRSVKEMANELKSSALDETLPSEIEELWYDEVRPKLDDLRKSVSTTRLAFETGKRLLTEGFGVPSILMGVANVAALTASLPTPLTVTAAVAGAGRIVAAGAHEAFEARKAFQKHNLVYLLDVDKTLGRVKR